MQGDLAGYKKTQAIACLSFSFFTPCGEGRSRCLLKLNQRSLRYPYIIISNTYR